MENQINIGDQSSQQIEQNPISKSVHPSEKPRLNYWIISIIVGLFLLVGLGTLYFYSYIRQKQSPSMGINPIPSIQWTPSLVSDRSLTERTIIYSVQKDSTANNLALFAIRLDGKQKVQLSEYQSSYEIGSGANIPKVAKTGSLVYLDGRNKLFIVDKNREIKLLAESTAGNEIRDFVISEDGTIVVYQEFNEPEPGQGCKNFFLRSVNTVTGEKRVLYMNVTNYLKPIKISKDKTRVFALGGSLVGEEASCYGPISSLQVVYLDIFRLDVIQFPKEIPGISLESLIISPDEKNAVVSFSTNPAFPLISTPSKEYPVKIVVLDLSTGATATLTESIDRYLFPIGWYSDSQSVLYQEQAPDTVENYHNIKDNYKKIDIQTKKITQLFTLERRAKGMEYSQILNDSLMIYTARSEQDWLEGTSLMKVNLDGSNQVELDKQIRFMYLAGIY